MTATAQTWAAGLGVNLLHSPHAPIDRAFVLPGNRVIANFGPVTEVEHAGRLARWLVRDGLADVLTWLGEDVGRRPERDDPRWSLANGDGSVVAIRL